jgi:putative methyltransferase
MLSSFYFEAAKTLDRLDAKQGSIKGVLATLPDRDRKRTAALVIETLKCEDVNHNGGVACPERNLC